MTEKYKVIFRFKKEYPVTELCKLFGVHRSGYYHWQNKANTSDNDEDIRSLIIECHSTTDKTYGYRRITDWLLLKKGRRVNHKAVLRIMNKYGLLSEIRRRRRYYQLGNQFRKYENSLNRDFSAIKPNQKWVTDISYIHTGQGVLYLSSIKDLYDNFIVSYQIGTTQETNLVLETVKQAKKEVADGLVLHSDQGGQYRSDDYYDLTKEYGIMPSMSRAGNPYDNACAENFFGILKTECIYRHKPATFTEARLLIDEYIHFYNFERIQAKNKLTPYEKRCQLA